MLFLYFSVLSIEITILRGNEMISSKKDYKMYLEEDLKAHKLPKWHCI